MATVTRHIDATPADVWAVLTDGWLYTNWVVGTSRIRDVDARWPAVGTALHHSFGVWPLVVNDRTDVKESVPGERLVLRTRGWPVGEAEVTVELRPDASGTEVVMTETPTVGPGAALAKNAAADWLITKRNTESLARLESLAKGGAARTER
jgi:uncharacterized protein YndB with AHSA1/START domain